MPIAFESIDKSFITNNNLVEIIDLGNHGLADSFFNPDEIDLAEESVPLVCMLDEGSGLVQLKNVTKSSQRYELIDYSYTSSNSSVSRNHWISYAAFVSKLIDGKLASVLEVGSNDGFLLSQFKGKTKRILGIDASPFMCDLANQNRIPTIHGTLGESPELVSKIKEEYKKFDVILANNVLNHANNPRLFLNDISELLSDDGIFVFEVPYWYETIKSGRFDQVYHEHIIYLTVTSIIPLLKLSGLYINDVQVVDYHGGSLRVQASKRNIRNSGQVDLFLQKESVEGFFTKRIYEIYMNQIKNQKIRVNGQIKEFRDSGYKVFGIGAAAKANTLLTYFQLTNDKIDFIVDTSPHKVGKITPVTKIPIVEDSFVRSIPRGVGLILAWNLNDMLRIKLLSLNPGLEFLEL